MTSEDRCWVPLYSVHTQYMHTVYLMVENFYTGWLSEYLYRPIVPGLACTLPYSHRRRSGTFSFGLAASSSFLPAGPTGGAQHGSSASGSGPGASSMSFRFQRLEWR